MADLVAIKGNKEGLRLQLDELAEWPHVLSALQQQLAQGGNFFEGAQLVIDVGERALSEGQLAEALALMQQYGLQPESLAATTRESRNAARAAGIAARPPQRSAAIPATGGEPEAIVVWRTVRSGQIVRHPGHITVLGDVNAGAEIVAGGHVIVWGRLRGFAHAGALGDRSALICALEMRPTQVRIADLIAQPGGSVGRTPEVARVEGDRISVEGWEVYRK